MRLRGAGENGALADAAADQCTDQCGDEADHEEYAGHDQAGKDAAELDGEPVVAGHAEKNESGD